VIVNGLVMGLSEIAYLMLLMLLVFYFFAVIALLFLKENDPQVAQSAGCSPAPLVAAASAHLLPQP
jgi:hypothetical protein